ncbi:MAG: DUF3520 domain-containing protein [Desulforudis sp.]|nr:MAG: DUF3520 domain-containing protein [Desulforudis sp.]
MKLTDNDLKKALREAEIPEPSETTRKRAVQEAADEFVKKCVVAEKKSKGFAGLLRLMGKIVQKTLTLQGEPIMTLRQFATVGILVIAIGLILSVGPQVFFPTKNVVDLPPSTTTPVPASSPGEMKQQTDKAKGQAAPTATAEPQASLQPPPLPETKESAAREDAAVDIPPAPAKQEANRRNYVQGGQLESEISSNNLQRIYEGPPQVYTQDTGRDRFAEIITNPVKLVGEEPVSTFSIDVDTASYAFVRRQLNNGVLPQKDAVRVEELINYFDYDYPVPADRAQPFKPSVAVYPTPWNPNTRLLHVGIKGYDIVPAEKPRANLVFLLDVSGSMSSPDKLPLLKNSLAMLVDSLQPDDTVAITVYAGAAGNVLAPTRVREKGKILAALDNLQAGGSTAGGEGIRLAYALAEMNYDPQAVNRVILATDGDFNVGITNESELKSFIERKRKTGISLSVLGFGQGNYNDALMQALAQNGNGNAAYIDSLNEARKVLVDEAGSTLFTIAKDVKIQVEFNPTRVHDYRLIGYETRLLKREDFNNDLVDAGEVGSGHSVTAIYEITPVESKAKLTDALRYQTPTEKPKLDPAAEYAFLKIRYKLPAEDSSKLMTLPIGVGLEFAEIAQVSEDMRFAAAVAAFGQLLRNDPYTGQFSYDNILQLAETARGRDEFGYRAEFLNLVRLARTAKAM